MSISYYLLLVIRKWQYFLMMLIVWLIDNSFSFYFASFKYAVIKFLFWYTSFFYSFFSYKKSL